MPLQAVYPVVPLNPANQGLTVGIISYDGRLCFGLLADRDLDPPLAVAAAALRASSTAGHAVTAASARGFPPTRSPVTWFVRWGIGLVASWPASCA